MFQINGRQILTKKQRKNLQIGVDALRTSHLTPNQAVNTFSDPSNMFLCGTYKYKRLYSLLNTKLVHSVFPHPFNRFHFKVLLLGFTWASAHTPRFAVADLVFGSVNNWALGTFWQIKTSTHQIWKYPHIKLLFSFQDGGHFFLFKLI